MTTRATALRTEADSIEAKLAALDKTDREALIRLHLELEFDRHIESLHNRAHYLDEAGE